MLIKLDGHGPSKTSVAKINNNNKSFIADNCPYTYIKKLKIQVQKYNIAN